MRTVLSYTRTLQSHVSSAYFVQAFIVSTSTILISSMYELVRVDSLSKYISMHLVIACASEVNGATYESQADRVFAPRRAPRNEHLALQLVVRHDTSRPIAFRL